MKITQVADVELISIKTKSLEDLDNDLNFNLNAKAFNRNEYVGIKNLNAKVHNKEYYVSNDKNRDFDYVDQVEEEAESHEDDNDHYESSVRFLTIEKSPIGACGFHLTRTKWDPYPWVSDVDDFTPAARSDLKAGDCVLEVNGCDVLGLRISEIAKLVKSSQRQVTLLLWSSNCNAKCDKENLCAAPMPRSLQRLSLVVQSILNLIECPVCLDTITPPAMQCQNGHLLCVDCRIRAEKCPVCRDRYFPRPALIAEQIQSAITSAFNLCRNEVKVRQKVFARHNRQRQMVKATLAGLQQNQHEKHQIVYKSLRTNPPTAEQEERNAANCNTKVSETLTAINGKTTDKFLSICSSSSTRNRRVRNKFFTKLLNSKSYSMENLTSVPGSIETITNNNLSTCQTTIKSATSQFEFFDMQQHQKRQQHYNSHEQVAGHRALFEDFKAHQQQQQTSPAANTNQFYDLPRKVAAVKFGYQPQYDCSTANDHTNLCCRQMTNNKMKHFPLGSDKEFIKSRDDSVTCILDSSITYSNGKTKISSSPMVCEASNATVPRAIRFTVGHCRKPDL